MVVAAGLLIWAGCDATDNEQAAANVNNFPPPGAPAEPPSGKPVNPPGPARPEPGAPGPGGPGGEPGGGRRSPIRNIMIKIDDRRPPGLTKAIKTALEAAQPDWPTIEKLAGEYASLAAELGTFDPPRGSKESWTRLTTALNDSATDLGKAARAKNKHEAVAASQRLSGSCMKCHREHRRMGGIFGPRGKGSPAPGGGPPPSAGPPPGAAD